MLPILLLMFVATSAAQYYYEPHDAQELQINPIVNQTATANFEYPDIYPEAEIFNENHLIKNNGLCLRGGAAVCGTNGFVYIKIENQCLLNAHNFQQHKNENQLLTQVDAEYCATHCVDINCPENLSPFCAQQLGTKLRSTMHTECAVRRHICSTGKHWYIVSYGACLPPKCPYGDEPICARNANMEINFENLCAVHQANLQAGSHTWSFVNIGPCGQPYTKIYDPFNITANHPPHPERPRPPSSSTPKIGLSPNPDLRIETSPHLAKGRHSTPGNSRTYQPIYSSDNKEHIKYDTVLVIPQGVASSHDQGDVHHSAANSYSTGNSGNIHFQGY